MPTIPVTHSLLFLTPRVEQFLTLPHHPSLTFPITAKELHRRFLAHRYDFNPSQLMFNKALRFLGYTLTRVQDPTTRKREYLVSPPDLRSRS